MSRLLIPATVMEEYQHMTNAEKNHFSRFVQDMLADLLDRKRDRPSDDDVKNAYWAGWKYIQYLRSLL